ncbi:MAG: RpiB/LacA/LacB family sugar-phosphate isomerase [Candidatus Saccharibacteria bacterium]|nr:RpiB/LacA/LacB family sugar-phosphate isomerase [Candidatus Saccharibacteria bacterium]
MTIYLGADYRGFEKKNWLRDFLEAQGHEVIDDGAYEYREGDDFNDPAIKVAKDVRENHGSMGILICDSAHGVTIQANRFKGIRAAHCDNAESAILAREHDDANVLCLSAHFMDEDLIKDITDKFLNTNFTNLERRVRRINRLDEREDYD